MGRMPWAKCWFLAQVMNFVLIYLQHGLMKRHQLAHLCLSFDIHRLCSMDEIRHWFYFWTVLDFLWCLRIESPNTHVYRGGDTFHGIQQKPSKPSDLVIGGSLSFMLPDSWYNGLHEIMHGTWHFWEQTLSIIPRIHITRMSHGQNKRPT